MVETSLTQDDRRRLTAAEQEHLLTSPLPGVLSTLADEGWIHSVPVHFHMHDQEIRIIAEREAVKTRNVRRTGRATMCVAATIEDERRYVMLEGPDAIHDLVSDEDLELLAIPSPTVTARSGPEGPRRQAVQNRTTASPS